MNVLRTVSVAVAAVAGLCVLAPPCPAIAISARQHGVVNVTPAPNTPDVNDGMVYAIGKSAGTVVLGGSFTNVSPTGRGSIKLRAPGLTAFDAETGALVRSFQPSLNGIVLSVVAGPTADTVYVGGDFTSIDGVRARLALISTRTGAMVDGWRSPSMNGGVDTVVRSGRRLYVGGRFTSVAHTRRVGLAVLDATTGALESVATPAFVGHHNYGVNCDPTLQTCADAGTGVKYMDLNPAGTKLVVDGNFTNVGGVHRDQIAKLNVRPDAVTLDTTWATDAFTSGCLPTAYDSYVRDVQFSPNGSYFVVAATGAGALTRNSDGTQTSCDSASRYETSATGSDVRPTWIDYTGNDTFLSVAITGPAVYVGGHQRWVNNSRGVDTAQEGSVPRPGIVALDPVNGLPLSWNPGRNPRGKGAYALLATSDGLYVGSDTDYIGNYRYLHKEIAFFPLVGGKKPAAKAVGRLPGAVWLLGSPTSSATARRVLWDGTAHVVRASVSRAVNWSGAHGAFQVNHVVYYGGSDGDLYKRSFDGRRFGAAVAVDPYDDPAWKDVLTGSGGTYAAVKSSFYGELPSLTAMFYWHGRVYYTLAGREQLFWRWFEPDSGVVGADEFTAGGTFNASQVRGAFLSGSTLYFATSESGSLQEVPFVDGAPSGPPAVANSSIDWSSAGAFVVTGRVQP